MGRELVVCQSGSSIDVEHLRRIVVNGMYIKPSLPSNLKLALIELQRDALTVKMWNTDMSFVGTIASCGHVGPVATTCVDVAMLKKVLNTMKKGPVEVAICQDGSLKFVAHDNEISIPKLMEPEDFPAFAHEFKSTTFYFKDVSLYKDCFDYVLRAALKDKSRTSIAQVCFNVENNTIVATDGHRLHLRRLDLQTTNGVKSFCIDTDQLKIALKCRNPSGWFLRGHVGESVVLWGDDWSLSTTHDNVDFPDYKQIVEENKPAVKLKMKTNELRGAFETISMISNNDSSKIVVKSDHVLLVNDEPGEATSSKTVPAVVDFDGEFIETEIKVNPKYMLDALAVKVPFVDLAISDSCSPIHISSDGDLLAIVMPQR